MYPFCLDSKNISGSPTFSYHLDRRHPKVNYCRSGDFFLKNYRECQNAYPEAVPLNELMSARDVVKFTHPEELPE